MRRVHAWVTEIGKTLMRGWAESLRGLWGKELAILGFTTAKTVMRFGAFFVPAAIVLGSATAAHVYLVGSVHPFLFLGMESLQFYSFSFTSLLMAGEVSVAQLAVVVAATASSLVLVFAAVATARPSLARKDVSYYATCFKRGIVPFFLSWLILPQMFFTEALLWFFLLDGAEKGWRHLVYAFGRTVAFHLLFLPMIVLVNLLVHIVEVVARDGLLLLKYWGLPMAGFVVMYTIVSLGILILFLSLLSSLYIKYKHRYHDLFFGRT